jgi:hypothetical protein
MPVRTQVRAWKAKKINTPARRKKVTNWLYTKMCIVPTAKSELGLRFQKLNVR